MRRAASSAPQPRTATAATQTIIKFFIRTLYQNGPVAVLVGTNAADFAGRPKLLRLLGKGFLRLFAENGPELRDDALKLQFP